MRLLITLLLLVGCTSANNIPLTFVYPIEEAHADEGWTRLERTISTGEHVTFLVPSTWMPQQMSDIGNLKVSIDRTDATQTTIQITQE